MWRVRRVMRRQCRHRTRHVAYTLPADFGYSVKCRVIFDVLYTQSRMSGSGAMVSAWAVLSPRLINLPRKFYVSLSLLAVKTGTTLGKWFDAEIESRRRDLISSSASITLLDKL